MPSHPEEHKVLKPSIASEPSIGEFITALLFNGSDKCAITALQLLAQIMPWIQQCLVTVKTNAANIDAKLGKYLNYTACFAAYQKATF